MKGRKSKTAQKAFRGQGIPKSNKWQDEEQEWQGGLVETISFGARMARFFLSAPCVIFHALVLFESMRRFNIDPGQLNIHHMVDSMIGFNGKCWFINTKTLLSTLIPFTILIFLTGPVIFAATRMGGFERMVKLRRRVFLSVCILFCFTDILVYCNYLRFEGTIVLPWYVEAWIWIGWIIQVIVKSYVWYQSLHLPETVGGRSLLIIFGGIALIFTVEFFHYGPPCTQDVLNRQTHPIEVMQQPAVDFTNHRKGR